MACPRHGAAIRLCFAIFCSLCLDISVPKSPNDIQQLQPTIGVGSDESSLIKEKETIPGSQKLGRKR